MHFQCCKPDFIFEVRLLSHVEIIINSDVSSSDTFAFAVTLQISRIVMWFRLS